MNELCDLMESGELTAEVFDGWVRLHHAMPGNGVPEPRSADSARLRVQAFDAFLMRPGVDDCRFIRAIIGMRNVFAVAAGLATPGTVVIANPLPPVRKMPPKACPSFSELMDSLLRPAGRGEPSF